MTTESTRSWNGQWRPLFPDVPEEAWNCTTIGPLNGMMWFTVPDTAYRQVVPRKLRFHLRSGTTLDGYVTRVWLGRKDVYETVWLDGERVVLWPQVEWYEPAPAVDVEEA